MKKRKHRPRQGAKDRNIVPYERCALLVRNPVAKFACEFNQARTFSDRKKRWKLGYRKHKGQSDLQAA